MGITEMLWHFSEEESHLTCLSVGNPKIKGTKIICIIAWFSAVSKFSVQSSLSSTVGLALSFELGFTSQHVAIKVVRFHWLSNKYVVVGFGDVNKLSGGYNAW